MKVTGQAVAKTKYSDANIRMTNLHFISKYIHTKCVPYIIMKLTPQTFYPLATERTFVRPSVRPSVSQSRFTLWTVTLYLVDTIAITVFAQSLSKFTCKLWMMRGGTLFILGHGVKGQGQLWNSVYKTSWTRYRLQFLPKYFQTSHTSGTLLILDHGVQGQGQLWHSIYKTFGHDTDCSFCTITFKLHI